MRKFFNIEFFPSPDFQTLGILDHNKIWQIETSASKGKSVLNIFKGMCNSYLIILCEVFYLKQRGSLDEAIKANLIYKTTAYNQCNPMARLFVQFCITMKFAQ